MTFNPYPTIKSSYYEANKEESTLLTYQRVNIETYLKHFLLKNSMMLQKLFFQVNDKYLSVIVYYYLLNYDSTRAKTRTPKIRFKLRKVNVRKRKIIPYILYKNKKKERANSLRKTLNLFEILKKPIIKKEVFKEGFEYRPSSLMHSSILIAKKYKSFQNKNLYKTKDIFRKNCFHEKVLETISLFTKNFFNVSLVFKKVNRGVILPMTVPEKAFLKKQVIFLKSYSRQKYFKDCLNLFIIGSKLRNSSQLFSNFMTEHLKHLKYHKPFISFVTKLLKMIIVSKRFVLRGIKLVISGRLNNKPRSKTFTSILGSVPTVTKNTEFVDYSESTCFTKNGTFGVKVWCNHSS